MWGDIIWCPSTHILYLSRCQVTHELYFLTITSIDSNHAICMQVACNAMENNTYIYNEGTSYEISLMIEK